MENASKALLIAGAVLIGVLLMSLAVYLFNTFGGATKQINDQLTASQISQFNSQFTKYEGRTDLRAHDLVSIANLARQNNEKYYGADYKCDDVKGEPYYINVIVEIPYESKISNFENYINDKTENNKETFIKDYSLKYDMVTPYTFECVSIEINSDTKLVSSITFKCTSDLCRTVCQIINIIR